MIVFDQVTKRYPDSTADVVNQLSLTIHDGEICILVGPSGCGKTTTMKMINKLIPPSSGSILIDGQDIGSIDTIQLRLNIGYIIQDIGLFPHMTVAENIATVPVELGWKKDRISARVDELLDLVELDPKIYRNKKPRELSGGQRQRIGVARALAADPKIMLMDEPFGALDPITRAKLQDEFLNIQAKIKKTIVFVTHDIDEALKMGDRIAVLKSGRVIQYGTPMEILARPADPFVSELIGGRNSLKMMNLLSCGDVMHKVGVATDFAAAAAVSIHATAQDALAEMFRTGKSTVLVLDDAKNVQGLIRLESLLESVSDYGRNS
ncbi:MAG: ABC transporter ATP-binding protein [Clostridia bacterium]|nr:ABC transporter ATP-binding protein [Clostridia bacterium]